VAIDGSLAGVKMLAEKSREARLALHEVLKPYHVSSDMGASRYVNQGRTVTVKHRLRKEAVVSLGKWEDGKKNVWFQTVELPGKQVCEEIGFILANWLDCGESDPMPELPTFPRYEQFDEKARKMTFPPQEKSPVGRFLGVYAKIRCPFEHCSCVNWVEFADFDKLNHYREIDAVRCVSCRSLFWFDEGSESWVKDIRNAKVARGEQFSPTQEL
jgi:hypothetical protein